MSRTRQPPTTSLCWRSGRCLVALTLLAALQSTAQAATITTTIPFSGLGPCCLFEPATLFDQFDPASGTLEQVTVDLAAVMQGGSFTITNSGTDPGMLIRLLFGATAATQTPPLGPPLLAVDLRYEETFSPFSPLTILPGETIVRAGPFSSSGADGQIFLPGDGALFDQFLGAGSLGIQLGTWERFTGFSLTGGVMSTSRCRWMEQI